MIDDVEYKEFHGKKWLTIKDDHAFEDILNGWPASKEAYYKHVKNYNVAIQAGGYCGIFPHMLSYDFSYVYTFEPDPLNFFCLVRNCENENVIKSQAALGNTYDMVRLIRENPNNRGIITVHKGGVVPQYRIDDLYLKDCNLIQLDVEGYELQVLDGARLTIDAFRPVISVEDNNERISDFLKAFGYSEVGNVYRDTIYAV